MAMYVNELGEFVCPDDLDMEGRRESVYESLRGIVPERTALDRVERSRPSRGRRTTAGLGPGRYRREVAVKVGGECVCVGDYEFAAAVLKVSTSTVRGWAAGRGPAFIEVVTLPYLYEIGDEGVLCETDALSVLHCSREHLVSRAGNESKRVSRCYRDCWALSDNAVASAFSRAREAAAAGVRA